MVNQSSNSLAWRDVPTWLRITFLVALLNFAGFVTIATINGGDALNGKEEGGRYYLASHGRRTEVSHAFYCYSKVHAASLFITHPAAIIGGFWLSSRKSRPSRGA
jgi:hypothetical protein